MVAEFHVPAFSNYRGKRSLLENKLNFLPMQINIFGLLYWQYIKAWLTVTTNVFNNVNKKKNFQKYFVSIR